MRDSGQEAPRSTDVLARSASLCVTLSKIQIVLSLVIFAVPVGLLLWSSFAWVFVTDRIKYLYDNNVIDKQWLEAFDNGALRGNWTNIAVYLFREPLSIIVDSSGWLFGAMIGYSAFSFYSFVRVRRLARDLSFHAATRGGQ